VHLRGRNYHIFYQLVKGASSEAKAAWGLDTKPPQQYRFLSQGVMDVDDVDDAAEYRVSG
jgi:myosin heavy subunit